MYKLALVIGHTQQASGAYSEKYGKEWNYNNKVTQLVKSKLANKVQVDIFTHETYAFGYTQMQRNTAKKINNKGYLFSLELHFNSANNTSVDGCEAFYFHKSEKGKQLATLFCDIVSSGFKINNRGAKPLFSVNQDGYGFIVSQQPPAVLLEPFFGSFKGNTKYTEDQYSNLLVQFLLKAIKKVS
jgi:N-acetylmuramoyl-L-alanine amidase